jgi:hypothetical protein
MSARTAVTGARTIEAEQPGSRADEGDLCALRRLAGQRTSVARRLRYGSCPLLGGMTRTGGMAAGKQDVMKGMCRAVARAGVALAYRRLPWLWEAGLRGYSLWQMCFLQRQP